MTDEILLGDARRVSSLVERGSVNCIITSPPYWSLKRYGGELDEEIGHGQSYEEYILAMRDVLKGCYEVAKSDGVLWVISDTVRDKVEGGGELLNLPDHLSDIAREAGWRLQDIVIWKKNKTLPWSGFGKLRNLIEYVFLFTKSQRFKHRPHRLSGRHFPEARWVVGWPERYHPLGRVPENIWNIDIPTQGVWSHTEHLHFCPLPQELVRRMIALTTDVGDVVLDPFAGVGSVPAQAELMGRTGIGVELSPSFIELHEERVVPAFAAQWHASTHRQKLREKDQVTEAEEILKLRCLKIGKELFRALDRVSHSGTSEDPIRGIETIVVLAPNEFAQFIDSAIGEVRRVPVRLVLIGHSLEGAEDAVKSISEGILATPPLTKYGLDYYVEVVTALEAEAFFNSQTTSLLEFEQSATQAYTREPEDRLFSSLRPRLLTNISLSRSYVADALDVLGAVRKDAEREWLESVLALDESVAEAAARLGIPQEQLQDLAERHGLVTSTDPIVVSMPSLFAADGSSHDW